MAHAVLSAPAAPPVASLPGASSAYRGRQIVVLGNGTTTADAHFVCLLSATGTYSWKQLSAG